MSARIRCLLCAGILAAASAVVQAHSGPPYPIVSDRAAGPYVVSIWTDPDTTDDGSPGGQFWVRIQRLADDGAVPDGTRATVKIKPLDRNGPELAQLAAPVRGDVANQFAALVMDHEGPFAVHVAIDGRLGTASIEATADATYDLRPPPALLALYLLPFLLVGWLWGRLLQRRRSARRAAGSQRREPPELT
jgi:hypothetical protein